MFLKILPGVSPFTGKWKWVNICNFLAKLLFQSKLILCKFLSKTDEQETNSFLLHILLKFHRKLLTMSRFTTPLIRLLNQVQKS